MMVILQYSILHLPHLEIQMGQEFVQTMLQILITENRLFFLVH